MADAHVRPVRGTQLLVEHMSDVLRRPSLVAIEIAWRWLFGIPFLLACSQQIRQILAAYPLDASGWDSVTLQNPWASAVQIAHVFSYYEPPAFAVMRWLLPAAGIAWIILSGLGRNLLLKRMASSSTAPPTTRPRSRPFSVMLFQVGWLILFGVTLWGWFHSMQWVSATHISTGTEPDLIGYFIWAIFLSLGFFTAFALISWPFTIAPLLAQFENRSAVSAFAQSLRLGKPFTSKLAEINLVMGIVKLALLVLAMVFSAAPLPFADELGTGALHMALAASALFYILANDFFQVVRLKAFLEFRKLFREQGSAA